MKLKAFISQRGQASLLARRLGVHVSTITRVASGEINPSAAMIKRICEASEGEIKPVDFFEHQDT